MTRYGEGDEVSWTYDVKQRYAEIDILGDNISEVRSLIDSFFNEVKIEDDNGENMFFDEFQTGRLSVYEEAKSES